MTNEEPKEDGIELQRPQGISYTKLYTSGYEERMVSTVYCQKFGAKWFQS